MGGTALCTAGDSSIARVLRYVTDDFERVILAFDNDKSGEEFTQEFYKALFKRNIKFDVVTLPNGIKDISDYYGKRLDLNKLAENATSGLEYLAKFFIPQEK